MLYGKRRRMSIINNTTTNTGYVRGNNMEKISTLFF